MLYTEHVFLSVMYCGYSDTLLYDVNSIVERPSENGVALQS